MRRSIRSLRRSAGASACSRGVTSSFRCPRSSRPSARRWHSTHWPAAAAARGHPSTPTPPANSRCGRAVFSSAPPRSPTPAVFPSPDLTVGKRASCSWPTRRTTAGRLAPIPTTSATWSTGSSRSCRSIPTSSRRSSRHGCLRRSRRGRAGAWMPRRPKRSSSQTPSIRPRPRTSPGIGGWRSPPARSFPSIASGPWPPISAISRSPSRVRPARRPAGSRSASTASRWRWPTYPNENRGSCRRHFSCRSAGSWARTSAWR